MTDPTKKRRKSRPKGGHRITDAAGRPVIGMWGVGSIARALPITFYYREVRRDLLTTKGVKVGTRRVRAEALRVVGESNLRSAAFVYAPQCAGFPDMLLLKSLRTYSKYWWVNARGDLERSATEYEARLPDLAPREGWTLASHDAVASLVAHQKQLPIGREPTDTERQERDARAQVKAASRARRLSTARSMVARYERRIKLDTTLLKKWKRREKALAKATNEEAP